MNTPTHPLKMGLSTGYKLSKPLESSPTYPTDIVQWQADVTATANILEYYQPFDRDEWMQRCGFNS